MARTLAAREEPASRRLHQNAGLVANILPSLGEKPIREITAPHLVAMVQTIQERGARDIAKRALETTGQIFRFAVAHGHVERNPAADIRPSDVLQKAFKSNYARIDAKELPHLLRQIQVYPGRHVTRIAIKLLALTFVRTGELIAAKWSEFDFEGARWDIPAERMKMRASHIVPLSRQTLECLAELHTLTGISEWLFPGEGQQHRPHEQQHDPEGPGANGLQGDNDGSWLPRPRLNNSA